MGYQTEFEGSFKVEPPLSAAEADYLKRFAGTRHCIHQPGPYVADGSHDCPGSGTCYEEGREVPGFWCKWEPDGDGTEISWNGMEKFYDADLWIAWLIRHLLGPDASGRLGPAEGRKPELRPFTCDHVLNGTVDAEGQDPDDRWQLIVTDNRATRRNARHLEHDHEVPA
jgi:hypothetical protein